jgi:hypothetical protein
MKTTKPPGIPGSKIAFFTSRAQAGLNIPVEEILEGIRKGQWRAQILKLRDPNITDKEYGRLKLRLPSFMVSATTDGGQKAADVNGHSGFLQLDIDKVGASEAPMLRERIGRDLHIIASWLSPGGKGVKAIMRIPADMAGHKAAFAAAAAYMAQTFAVKIDPSCCNLNRLCFVSHDPELVFNPNAEILPVSVQSPEPSGGKEERDSSTSLHTESASTSTSYITGPFFTQWPDLAPLYGQQVTRRFGKPQRGQRNSALVEIAASLYCVLIPDFVSGFALAYRNHHEEIFVDYPEEQVQREVRSVLDGCAQSYPDRLPNAAREAYQTLADERERTAFRVCESLSKCETDPTLAPPQYYLSCHQLGLRLGIMDTPAHRILRMLEARGFLQTVSKGTRREKSKAGIATIYRWLL